MPLVFLHLMGWHRWFGMNRSDVRPRVFLEVLVTRDDGLDMRLWTLVRLLCRVVGCR
jgi:hypothetical protein